MSFFSKDQTSDQNSQVTPGINVRTMEDDLNKPLNELHETNTSARDFFTQKNTSSQNIPPATGDQNPFLSQTETQKMTEDAKEIEVTHTINPYQANATLVKESPKRNLLPIIVSFIILLGCILAGLYYFLKTRNTPDNTDIVTPPSEVVDDSTKEEELIEPIVVKDTYSATTPNYYPIDISTATPQSIQTNLQQLTQNVLKEAKTSKAIEFYITDNNNTPISFASFAKATEITIPQNILADLGDNFSLFVYNDGGAGHLGLVIDSKNGTNIEKNMRAEELKLLQAFKPLFLGDTASIASPQFNDGIYKDMKLRYVNLHPETKLSFDYAITTSQLIIGTSMLTHHALLDTVKK